MRGTMPPIAGYIVRLNDHTGLPRCVDYTREGESWGEAAMRLYHRFFVHDGYARYITSCVALPFSEYAGGHRYKLTFAAMITPTIHEPSVTAVIDERRTRPSSRPDHHYRRYGAEAGRRVLQPARPPAPEPQRNDR